MNEFRVELLDEFHCRRAGGINHRENPARLQAFDQILSLFEHCQRRRQRKTIDFAESNLFQGGHNSPRRNAPGCHPEVFGKGAAHGRTILCHHHELGIRQSCLDLGDTETIIGGK